MRKLVVAVLLLGVLVAVDLAARAVAQSQLEDRVQRAVRQTASADVSISSFPFLGRLLASGHISRVTVGLSDLGVRGLRFSSIVDDLHDVQVDRGLLVSERRVALRSIGRGSVAAEVTEAELARAIGVPVALEQGRARVTVAGRSTPVSLRVRNGRLALDVAGTPVGPLPTALAPLAIPRAPLLPCVADVEILPGKARLTCTFDRVPPELIGAANRLANR